MRSNMMRKCAVGAMLFGGTLGGVSTAQAGFVTWLNSDPSRPEPNALGASYVLGQVYDAYTGDPNAEQYVLWAATKTAGSATFGGASASWTASGRYDNFSITATNNPGVGEDAQWVRVMGARYFQVTGSQEVNFSITSSGPTSGGYFGVYTMTQLVWDSATQGSNFTQTLGAGLYWVTFVAAVDVAQSTVDPSTWEGVAGSASINFVVPAPGAAALVSLAGLMTRRRKA